MKQRGIAIEHWAPSHRRCVVNWLEANYGSEGERWGTQYDYGLDNLYMDEDVYILYLLKWA